MRQQDDSICLTFPCGKSAVVCISIGEIIHVAYCATHWQAAKQEYDEAGTPYVIEWIAADIKAVSNPDILYNFR